MEILRRCPMLAVLSAIAAGLALYDRAGGLAFIAAVPVIFVGVMFCSYEWELPEQWQVFAFTMIFTLLCSWRIYAVISSKPPENFVFIAEEGTVTDVREWGKAYAVVIDTESRGKYAAFLKFADFMKGTRLKFDGETRGFRPKLNGSDFDEGKFWRARGVNGVITLHNPEELPQRFSLSLMRYKLSRKLTIYTPNLTSSYLRSAWTGERDKSLNDRHRKWGTSHLLAVSGFHVWVVIMCAMYFAGKDPVILSVILWVYILLTGAAPSAMRAGLMIQIMLCAKFWKRPYNGVNSVCSAGVILLLWSPFLFWDIGWRLSIISALVIAAVIGSMRNSRLLWLILSPSVGIAVFPQAAYTFGNVPVAGFVMNLFAPMYFSFAFSIASLGALLRLVDFPLSQYFMFAVEGIFILWEKIADTITALIPYLMGWNYVTAWIGCGTLIYVVCRYLDIAPIRTAAIMGVIGFIAFALFL